MESTQSQALWWIEYGGYPYQIADYVALLRRIVNKPSLISETEINRVIAEIDTRISSYNGTVSTCSSNETISRSVARCAEEGISNWFAALSIREALKSNLEGCIRFKKASLGSRGEQANQSFKE